MPTSRSLQINGASQSNSTVSRAFIFVITDSNFRQVYYLLLVENICGLAKTSLKIIKVQI
jgi:hypothetical protein